MNKSISSLVAILILTLAQLGFAQSTNTIKSGDYVRYKSKVWHKLYEVQSVNDQTVQMMYNEGKPINEALENVEKVDFIQKGSILYTGLGLPVSDFNNVYNWFKVGANVYPPFNMIMVEGNWVRTNPGESTLNPEKVPNYSIREIVNGPIDTFSNVFFTHRMPENWHFEMIYEADAVNIGVGDLVKKKSAESGRYDVYKVSEIEPNGNVQYIAYQDWSSIETARCAPIELEKVLFIPKEATITTRRFVYPSTQNCSDDCQRIAVLKEDWTPIKDSILCSIGYVENGRTIMDVACLDVAVSSKILKEYAESIVLSKALSNEDLLIKAPWYSPHDFSRLADPILQQTKTDKYLLRFKRDGYYYLNSMQANEIGYQDPNINKYIGRWVLEGDTVKFKKGKDALQYELKDGKLIRLESIK